MRGFVGVGRCLRSVLVQADLAVAEGMCLVGF
jgi:hypothetical protein